MSRSVSYRTAAPETRKSSRRAALRMARPGLEPGTPRFSVVRLPPSNSREMPANITLSCIQRRRLDQCKFRSFRRDSGDGFRLVSQYGARTGGHDPRHSGTASCCGVEPNTLRPADSERARIARTGACSSVASASSRPAETPGSQTSSRPSVRVALRPLLRFVRLDSEWRLDQAAADGWVRWGAAVSASALAHRPERPPGRTAGDVRIPERASAESRKAIPYIHGL